MKCRCSMTPQHARDAPTIHQLAKVTRRSVNGRHSDFGDAITTMRRANYEIGLVLVPIPLRLNGCDDLGTQRAKSRLAVGQTQPRHRTCRGSRKNVRETTMGWDGWATNLSRPDHDVREIECLQKAWRKRGIVLAIGVERDHRTARKALDCERKRGAKGCALAAVGVKADYVIARPLQHPAGCVRGSVIHSHHKRPRDMAPDRGHHRRDRRLGVERGKDTHGYAPNVRRIGAGYHSATSSPSEAGSSRSIPSSAAPMRSRSRSIESTVPLSSASRAALLSAPFFR